MLAKLVKTQPVGIPSHALLVQLFCVPNKTNKIILTKSIDIIIKWAKPTNQPKKS